jgi:EAL domain-containing protein (putative c-di-GMP-specific phosphodiesterase class I)/PleD family two-component response regulator
MKKILIIEDDKLLLETLSDLLTHEGFEIFEATDGNVGITIAKNILPDLIISDINMPGISGHKVLKELQQDAGTSNIPFIFLTGDADLSAMRKGMRLGADDYIPKPVILGDLLESVKIRLNKYRKIQRQYEEELTRTRYNLELTKHYEPITRLPKKTVLENDFIHQKEIYQSHNVSLLMIRIDRLRELVEILEPAAYKEILNIIVGRIQTVMSDNQKLYWFDNNILGLFVGNFLNEEELLLITKKLFRQIRQNLKYRERELRFTASIGISVCSPKKCDIKDLLSEADIALSIAREKGHNNFQFFTPELRKQVHDRIKIESELHRAVDNNEFYFVYQPKYQLEDEKVVGMEALVRWNNPRFGTLLPAKFIPIAEQNGLIVSLGEWITGSICNQVNRWTESGMKVPRIAINVSGNQIEEANFVRTFSKVLDKTGIDGNALEIELTESILVKNSKQTHRKLIDIKELGLNISIDDFGTGYSSLQYLKNFPHDTIKIDQSFIKDLALDKNSKSIVSSIISMAHGMGVKVVAEGVEEAEQVEILKFQKCDEIQGYYYSKPVSPEHISQFVQS